MLKYLPSVGEDISYQPTTPRPQKREEREKRKILEEILTYFKRKFKHISLCCEIKHTKSKKIFLMENIKEDLNQ